MRPRLKAPFIYAAAMAALCALGVAAIAFLPAANAADPIKQSRSGICWCPGGSAYDRTTNFTAFDTIEACLEAEGRHPKKGQGECSPPVASIGDATTQAILDLRASLEGLSLRVAMLEAASIEASAAPEPPPTRTAIQAFNHCQRQLAKDVDLWSSKIADYCGGIAPENVDDYLECFGAQREAGASGKNANKRCRHALGIQ